MACTVTPWAIYLSGLVLWILSIVYGFWLRRQHKALAGHWGRLKEGWDQLNALTQRHRAWLATVRPYIGDPPDDEKPIVH